MEIFGIHVIAAMMLAGALGGVLFGYRKQGLVFPRWKAGGPRSLDLGFIADSVWGASGALVVFIIIPLDLKNGGDVAAQMTHHIRLLAIAFIGGYGGPAIMDLALSRTFKDLARRTEEVAQRTELVHSQLEEREQQEVRDIKALECVDIQLSDTMQPVMEADLIDAIKTASPAALENIFQRTKETRHEAWLRKEKGEPSHQLTERTVPIFRGLLASHYGKQRHRYHAQLGYALKDQDTPEWEQARDALDNAITLLQESGRPMSPYYAFNWALCAIKLDGTASCHQPSAEERRRAIVGALCEGAKFWKLRVAILEDADIRTWLTRNGLSLDSIGPSTSPARAVQA